MRTAGRRSTVQTDDLYLLDLQLPDGFDIC